jgi:hypothetical protein
MMREGRIINAFNEILDVMYCTYAKSRAVRFSLEVTSSAFQSLASADYVNVRAVVTVIGF